MGKRVVATQVIDLARAGMVDTIAVWDRVFA